MDLPAFVSLLGFSEKGWGPALLTAAGMTVLLSASGVLLGALFGGLAAFARLRGGRLARGTADAYCTLFRGVPDLLTIYLLYFGGSSLLTAVGRFFGAQGFVGLPTFATGVLALAIISGAYQAEVYRGAFLAIPAGQIEAARALAMPGPLMLRRIILPQLLRYAIPGLGNVWQLILKDSALLSVIGLVELMRQSQIGAGSTRQPFVFYIAAAVLYLVITFISGALIRRAEKRSLRGVRRA
ncbi:ABC transporter permease [Ancylobacter sp.]|uniref:ABC transporter permease n=1 Tax=Ancylobacter sp. TaxID=1872567 RepID=UPI003BAB4722